MNNIKNNYYISSFFWSTFSKILNAILGFVSIPLLLGFYGQANFGILSIATACNSYMHLLDLGMNVGAIKYFSKWREEGEDKLIDKVAFTNITFYSFIGILNAAILLLLAFFGENLFSLDRLQFIQLQRCLIILALFAIFNWGATTFNQLLIVDKHLSFTMKTQCILTILKGALIFIVLWQKLSLTIYFFILSSLIALLIIPYAAECRNKHLISKIRFGFFWHEFKPVVLFSLSIFALSIFQVTATQSRPILLSIFSTNGPDIVAEFRIIEVIPLFIIMVGGTFSSIFLPQSSKLVVKANQDDIESFAYKWTKMTSIIANCLCIPFIFAASDILAAYVGQEYSYLSIWLVVWCISVLFQIHTTPGNSLVLAYGNTKPLIWITGIACVVSMVINIVLCNHFGVGSAVIGYAVYVLIIIGSYYIFYYKRLIHLSRWRMFKSFLIPTVIAFILMFCIKYIPYDKCSNFIENDRLRFLFVVIFKTICWIIPYIGVLFILKIFRLDDFKKE